MSQTLDQALLQLDDYVRGVTPASDVDAFEDDLFERALACRAPELDLRSGLEGTLRDMKKRGTLELWLTRSQVEALANSGLKISYYELNFADPQPPQIAPDADLLVAKIPVDLSGVKRIEVEVLADDGRVLKVMPDIHFESNEGAVFGCCEAELARTASAAERTTRFWAFGEDAERRLLLEVRAI
jgi:hypothetical protein